MRMIESGELEKNILGADKLIDHFNDKLVKKNWGKMFLDKSVFMPFINEFFERFDTSILNESEDVIISTIEFFVNDFKPEITEKCIDWENIIDAKIVKKNIAMAREFHQKEILKIFCDLFFLLVLNEGGKKNKEVESNFSEVLAGVCNKIETEIDLKKMSISNFINNYKALFEAKDKELSSMKFFVEDRVKNIEGGALMKVFSIINNQSRFKRLLFDNNDKENELLSLYRDVSEEVNGMSVDEFKTSILYCLNIILLQEPAIEIEENRKLLVNNFLTLLGNFSDESEFSDLDLRDKKHGQTLDKILTGKELEAYKKNKKELARKKAISTAFIKNQKIFNNKISNLVSIYKYGKQGNLFLDASLEEESENINLFSNEKEDLLLEAYINESMEVYKREINLSDELIELVIDFKNMFGKEFIKKNALISSLAIVDDEFWRNLKSYTDLKNYVKNSIQKPNLKNLLKPRDGVVVCEKDIVKFEKRKEYMEADIRNCDYIHFPSMKKMILNENNTLDMVLATYHAGDRYKKLNDILESHSPKNNTQKRREIIADMKITNELVVKYFYALRLNKQQKLYGVMSNEWLKNMGLDLSKNACINILKGLAASITLTINNKDLADFEKRLNEQSNSQKGFSIFIESILEKKGKEVDCSNLINQIPKGLKCVINKYLKHTIAKKMIDRFKKEGKYDEALLNEVIQKAEFTKEELSIS